MQEMIGFCCNKRETAGLMKELYDFASLSQHMETFGAQAREV